MFFVIGEGVEAGFFGVGVGHPHPFLEGEGLDAEAEEAGDEEVGGGEVAGEGWAGGFSAFEGGSEPGDDEPDEGGPEKEGRDEHALEPNREEAGEEESKAGEGELAPFFEEGEFRGVGCPGDGERGGEEDGDDSEEWEEVVCSREHAESVFEDARREKVAVGDAEEEGDEGAEKEVAAFDDE